MPKFEISAVGVGTETYIVEAEHEAEARAKFLAGDIGDLVSVSVDETEIVDVEEVDE
jgi:hypothetical protein